MHTKVEGDFSRMLLTAVYRSPNNTMRDRLWNDLTSIGKNITEPWIIAGDFNCILNVDKKTGGRVAT